MTKSALLSQNGSIHTFRSSIEYESVLSRHDKFVDDWNDNNLPNTLEKGGIEIVRDQGKLYGHLCVAVTSNSDNGDTNSSNGNEIFNEGMSVAKYAVALSTGCSAVIPSQVQGLVEAHPWTSRNTTSAKKSPHSLGVACEMAHAWWALGTEEVTIIGRHKGILNIS